MTNFEWLDNMLGNKISKEAMESQGTDKQDHFERKVKAHDWINGVTNLDPVAVEAEYIEKLKQEAMILGKTAALDDVIADGVTEEETVNKDYKRGVASLSDYALAEMLAEARGHDKQNTSEMFYELKEKAKSEVASSREKAEKALLDLIPNHTMLDWQKAFKAFTKDAVPAEAKEKDLFRSDVPEKDHDFEHPTEEKFKVPADQEKAIPGNGREADERKEVTQEAGVLQDDITKGLGKDAALKTEAHCGSCPGDPGMEQKGAPEEMEKDAASNDAAIAGFISGQGGSSSANLHVVKGTKGMVLVNYETPIAYRSADGILYMNSDKYSQTTSSIQSKIRQAAGGQIKEVSAAELETIMEGKPGIVPNAPAAAQPLASKEADGASASDNCPVCGTVGKDLGNGEKDNMSCEACGLTYACGSISPKADLETDGIMSAEEIAETFINGNISDARKAIGNDISKFVEVLEALGGSPEADSFKRLMGKHASREIKNAATKSQVIQKIAELSKKAEVSSPWVVQTDENGQEVIARVEQPSNEKVSEEDPTTEIVKSAAETETPVAPVADEDDKDKAPTDVATPAPVAAPAAVVAPAAPVAAPAAAVVPPAPAASTGDTTSPTRTNTETGGSSPGGASTGGVGSGIGGAGTGGAATGGASTGGAGTVNVTLSGNSGTGSNSDGGKETPVTINISNVGGTTDAGDVASGDGPGSAGEGGKGEGSGGGGGGASPDEPRNFSTSKKDEKKDESDSSMFAKDDGKDETPAAAPATPAATASLKPLNSAASWIRDLLK